MKIRQEPEGPAIVTLLEIEPFFLDLLQRIAESGNPGDDAVARDRLFSAPVDASEAEMRSDWGEFVVPELRELFRTAQQTVESDLAALPAARVDWTGPTEEFEEKAFGPTAHELAIPRQHAEAWLSALNQARLVIAARRGFGERDMEMDLPMPPFDARRFDLFQIHFYDYLQQLLLQGMGFD